MIKCHGFTSRIRCRSTHKLREAIEDISIIVEARSKRLNEIVNNHLAFNWFPNYATFDDKQSQHAMKTAAPPLILIFLRFEAFSIKWRWANSRQARWCCEWRLGNRILIISSIIITHSGNSVSRVEALISLQILNDRRICPSGLEDCCKIAKNGCWLKFSELCRWRQIFEWQSGFWLSCLVWF